MVVAALFGPIEGPKGICKQTHMVFSCSLILFMVGGSINLITITLVVIKTLDGSTLS